MKERHFSQNKDLLDIIDSTEKLSLGEKKKELHSIIEEYMSYKKSFVRNVKYDPKSYDLGKYIFYLSLSLIIHSSLASTIEYPTLDVIEIYFGAATYDEIEKDVKVTLEAALGLIGGTMGLLTGFSLLSGVEIIFYIVKLLFSLKRRNSD